jgi:hypothetical protein
LSIKKTDLNCLDVSCKGELVEEDGLFICLECGAEYTEDEVEDR